MTAIIIVAASKYTIYDNQNDVSSIDYGFPHDFLSRKESKYVIYGKKGEKIIRK